ncbi:Bcr/CflA family drug resistance efflux transporter [Loktanella sp. D2R18]|uniref:multidrug effflux MFS transporter n=1 Tax=Rhodobacterales TaxID=204455 RepID=UPI000DE85298|nr:MULTISPECIES: multidrug effflux MFS transporter [Rhodobacterales]MDO6589199.1 multidrug effflux MFS transporter [Yoonia sp. 1_MG-2023]RBW45375.1 Bcr/CflA family drug resistance efflux transporter [Loktanella sp. D2R18]
MSNLPFIRFLDRSTPPHIMTLVLITGMSALSMTIFLPSLAKMTADFETDYAIMQIALSGYLAATAVLQIFVGPISDRYGRRIMILGSLSIFIIASIGAMLSHSIELFLFFRILQAAVATNMALSRAIVRDIVSQEEAASLMGYVTMGTALVPMFGPMIGGVLDEAFNWHATFAFLALAGTATLVLVYLDLGETVAKGGVSFRDQIKGYPELFRSPRFWGYALCSAFSSGAFFALLGGASFVGSTIFGLSPMWSGIALGAPAVGYSVGNYLSGRFSVRLGINTMAIIGTGITIVGLSISAILTMSGVAHPLNFFGFCIFLGLGNGIALPNVMAGSISVRPHLAGTASGLSGAIMIGGGAALSQFAGGMLTVETGTLPLQLLMLGTGVLALLSVLFVVWRESRIT